MFLFTVNNNLNLFYNSLYYAYTWHHIRIIRQQWQSLIMERWCITEREYMGLCFVTTWYKCSFFQLNYALWEQGRGGAPSAGAGILLQLLEETAREQVFLGSLWRGPCQSRWILSEKLWPVEHAYWNWFILKDWSPWRGPVLEQGKNVRKKWQRGAVPDWLQTPLPTCLCHLEWGAVGKVIRNEGMKLNMFFPWL